MGKGSKTRPREVSYDQWCNNWDQIFGTRITKEESGTEPAYREIKVKHCRKKLESGKLCNLFEGHDGECKRVIDRGVSLDNGTVDHE